MFHAQRFTLIHSKRLRELDGASDLPPIEVVLHQLVQVDVVRDGAIAFQRADVIEEVHPHLSARDVVQVVVVEGDGDTRVERLVNGFDSVGGQEEHTIVVLQQA